MIVIHILNTELRPVWAPGRKTVDLFRYKSGMSVLQFFSVTQGRLAQEVVIH